jgi:hypothetical protein
MIEVPIALKWALIFFVTSAEPNGSEKVSSQRAAVDYATLASCQEAGNDLLAEIEMAEGYFPYAVCIPVDQARPR